MAFDTLISEETEVTGCILTLRLHIYPSKEGYLVQWQIYILDKLSYVKTAKKKGEKQFRGVFRK